jgi:hypothetical protein
LFGDGAGAFRKGFDLIPDPVGVLWAIRERSGAIVDFRHGVLEPGDGADDRRADRGEHRPASARGGTGLHEDEAYRRMRAVLETGQADVVEVSVVSGDGPIGRVRGV